MDSARRSFIVRMNDWWYELTVSAHIDPNCRLDIRIHKIRQCENPEMRGYSDVKPHPKEYKWLAQRVAEQMRDGMYCAWESDPEPMEAQG